MRPTIQYLLGYMEKRFDEMTQRFNQVDQRLNDLEGAVDAYAKRADAYFQEMIALSHKERVAHSDESEGRDGAGWQGGRAKRPEA